MNKYQILSQRFYNFFKYLRTLTIISFVLFAVITAINTNNEVLIVVSYVLMMLTIVCLTETVILYGLYIIFKNRSENQ